MNPVNLKLALCKACVHKTSLYIAISLLLFGLLALTRASVASSADQTAMSVSPNLVSAAHADTKNNRPAITVENYVSVLNTVFEIYTDQIQSSSVDVEIRNGDYRSSRGMDSNGNFKTEVAGSYAFRGNGNETSNQFLTVEAQNLSAIVEAGFPLSELANLHPLQGTLRVSAEDGSRLLLNAATGNSATVAITLENSEGLTALIQEWAMWDSSLLH